MAIMCNWNTPFTLQDVKMKFKEIALKVKNDEITLDSCGHRISEQMKDRFISHFENLEKGAVGEKDGKWTIREDETMEETNRSMREFYQRHLDNEIQENESLFPSCEGSHCFGCGEKLNWVLNGDKLTLRQFYNHEIQRPNLKWKGGFDLRPLDYRCPYEHAKPFSGEIKVSSKLIFANFFRWVDDSTEENKYKEEYCINYLIGRENTTKYKCANNIAYGQMSNMSIGIYVNENKDSIIIGPAYHPIEFSEEACLMNDEEYEAALKKPVFEGFKLAGTICLGVWRWEATDFKTIGKENYAELIKENQDIVELKVKHGIWQFEHYFDRLEDEKDYCYSKFNLKK